MNKLQLDELALLDEVLDEYPPPNESVLETTPLLLEGNGLSILVVFFHQRFVLLLHVLVEDEPEEDRPEDFIHEGHDGFGKESEGAFHCGLGSDGHSHELTPLSLILGMEVSGAGVSDVPEKSVYLLDDVEEVLVPSPKGFHQLRSLLS